ncbi:MAG: 2,3-diaminopropionate biosynthesis protein SbnA [Acidobacteriota bacterium]|nr:2,3-diaminopropionate biosynthesis protein SbnA [Acidobacteriota bacterium]
MPEGVLSAVGNTPLALLDQLFSDFPGQVWAKLEGLNPGGSAKDRPAREMLAEAFAEGLIDHDTVIVESSSGNMGIGLAQACARYGLRFICVVDVKTTVLNRRILEVYGAEVELVKTPEPVTGELLQARLQRVEELCKTHPNSFWPNQYANRNNSGAHYRSTIREVVEQLGAAPDHLFVATSTCGTLRGCCDFIRDHGFATRIIAVDAVGSRIFGQEKTDRWIPGIGAGVRPPLCPEEWPGEVVHVTDRECVEACRWLVRREGILAGGSSGAVVSAFDRLQRELPPDSRCVLVLPDRGERYLDTVYDDGWVEERLGLSTEGWGGPPATPLVAGAPG